MNYNGAKSSSSTGKVPIWTPTYVGVCAVIFLAYIHNGILTPTIPLYIREFGGSAFMAGLILAIFSVFSFGIRPFTGQWADRKSVLGVFGVGTLLLGVTGFAILIPILWLLPLINAVRGIGWALVNTGGTTLVARIAPTAHRGEASSYYTLFSTGASILSPALALWLLDFSAFNFNVIFLISGGCGLAALTIVYIIPRHAAQSPEASSHQDQPRGRHALLDLYDYRILYPTFLLACLMVAQPAAMAFLPLYTQDIGISAGAVTWYYIVSGVASIGIRFALGSISDRLGREFSIVMGYLSSILGILLLIVAFNVELILVAGIFYGVGQAVSTPAMMAMAIDRADPSRPGAAMATYTSAYQLGLGIGAVLSGTLIELAGYKAMYLGAICTITMGLVVIILNKREKV